MLTDTQIRNARSSGTPFKLFDARGLYLHVMPNGGRYWRFKYRFCGKEKVLALGVYPDVPLARARTRHQAAREMLAQGSDPAAAKRTTATTFESAARAWYRHWMIGRNARHATYVLRRLETDVFPQIGARPLSELSASTFREVVQKIERRGAVDIAKRVLQTCGQVMRHAVAHDLVSRNPVGEIKPSDVLQPRKRRNYPRVGVGELPDLLRAIDGYVGGEHTRLALQIMSLTFVRTSELIGARWSEFDFDELRWDIPAERMKMRTPHIVPLSTQAKAVLEKLKAISFDRELVFPGDVNPAKPMSNIPRRMSVTPAASHTCVVSGNPIIPTRGNRKIPTHPCEGDSDGRGQRVDEGARTG